MSDVNLPRGFGGKALTKEQVLKNLFPTSAQTPAVAPQALFNVQPEMHVYNNQVPPMSVVPMMDDAGEVVGEAMSFNKIRETLLPQETEVQLNPDGTAKPDFVMSRQRSKAYTKEELKELGLD